MPEPRLLRPDTTGLLVIDLQQPLLNVMWNQESLIANARRLLQGAQLLDVPVLVTEQNPGKLGPTGASIAEVLGDAVALPKLAFSCCREQPVWEALDALQRDVWLICGLETHVCVAQTALDLLARGQVVHVAADAVGSRAQANWQFALDRLRHAGATITTTEMALFELLERAGTDQFRAVQKLIR